MNIKIGGLYIELGADTKDFDTKTDKSTDKVHDLGKEFKAGIGTAAKWGAALATAAAVGLGKIIADSLAAVDAQAKMAKQLGGTVNAMKALELAGERSGVQIETLEQAISVFNSRLNEASSGTGKVAEAFEELGLSAEDLSEMDVDERMATVADAIADMGLNATETAGFLRDIGIRQSELIPLMIDGGDAIRDASKFVKDYGLGLSDIDSTQVEVANDNFNDALKIIKAVGEQLAVKFAPILSAISQKFKEVAKESSNMGETMGKGVQALITGFMYVADVVEALKRVFQVLSLAIDASFASMAGSVIDFAASITRYPVKALELLMDILNSVGKGFVMAANAANWLLGIDGRLEWPNLGAGLVGDVKTFQSELEGAGELMAGTADAAIEEMTKIMTAPLPSSTWKPELDRLLEDFRSQVATATSGTEGDGGETVTGLNALGDPADTEDADADTSNILQNRLREHQAAMLEIDRQGMLARVNVNKEGLAQLLADSSSAQSQAVSIAGDSAKAIFDQSKEVAIAAGLLNAYQAIMSAYRVGMEVGGPAAAVGLAALAGAAQFATLSKIKNTDIGSSGSGIGIGGGGSGAPVASPSTAGGSSGYGEGYEYGATSGITKINIIGGDSAQFSGQQIRDLIDQINRQVDRGMKLQVQAG